MMSHRLSLGVMKALLCVGLLCCLVSCGMFRKSAIPSKISALDAPELSPSQQRKFDYYFYEAVRLKEKGAWDEAFDMYSHCLAIHPNSAVVQYELSQFYMYLGQHQRGESALKVAVAAEPENYWYKQTLAAYYQNRGENLKAIDVLEDMSAQFPSRLEPLLTLVDLYNRTKDYTQVINTLNRLERIDGKSEQISMEKFRMYLALDNQEQAFSEIENLVKEYPYDMRYLTILGDVYMENDKDSAAYSIYQDVLQKEPDYVPAMLSLAGYYEKTGMDSLYKEQVDSILLNEKVGVDAKTGLLNRLIVRSEMGDKDSTRIMTLFDTMLAQEQETADVAMLAARYYLSKGMDKQAEPVLFKVLEIDPETKSAYLQLLQFAIRRNNMDEVIAICTPAVEYLPESLEFYYYLGLAHYQKQQKEEALEVFKKGVRQITPTTDKGMASDFYSIMGDLYHDKKMNTEAYAAYDSALVYKPDNIGVLNNYAYYLSVERKDLDKAEEMSYRTVKAEPSNGTYLDTYAWILFEKGKYAEARIYMDQAMQNGGDQSSVVVEHCGDIYYKLGEVESAVEYWKQAEKLANEAVEETDKRDAKELKLLRRKIANKKYFER